MLPFLAAVLTFVAAAVASALAILLPAGGRGLNEPIAAVSLGVGLLAGAGAFFHTRRMADHARVRAPLSLWAWAVFTVFAMFALRSFCWLVFEDGAHSGAPAQLMVGNIFNLGDISLHLLYIHDFANGAHWWPEHPQASGYAMRYYPGMDLFQALLLLLGADDLHSLAWVGLAGSLLALLALYRWGGSFAVAGFLFAGGLAGFQFLYTGKLIDFQTDQEALAWKSLPLAIFVTQRPFLFALPAGLLLMAHWREKFFAARPLPDAAGAAVPWSRRGLIPFWVELLLYAVLPAFHLFAFIFVSVLLGWWFMDVLLLRSWKRWLLLAAAGGASVFSNQQNAAMSVLHWLALAALSVSLAWWLYGYWESGTRRYRHLLVLVGAALLPATGLVYLMTDHFQAGSHIKLQWGWMQHDEPFWKFWPVNFGLFALLAPALWLWCACRTAGVSLAWFDDAAAAAPDRPSTPVADAGWDAASAFTLPAGALFLATCVWLFAPWEWDNTKLMIWCYLAVLPFLWERFLQPLSESWRAPICALLFFSGAVSLASGLGQPNPRLHLLEMAELDDVRWVVRDLPAEARFAAAPDYNHPLAYCGRKVAEGYAGHLYSQGIDSRPIESDLDTLMRGSTGWREAAARLDVRYVFWGPREEKRYPESTLPWADPDEPVAACDHGKIYEIKPAAESAKSEGGSGK